MGALVGAAVLAVLATLGVATLQGDDECTPQVHACQSAPDGMPEHHGTDGAWTP